MSRTALLVIDVQPDFCEGGPLAVAGGDAVAHTIGGYMDVARYDLMIASLDWHAPAPDTNCGHFALDGQPDYVTSWPVHCVADTPGAALHDAIRVRYLDAVVRKGYGAQSYSAFEGVADSGLSLLAVLRSQGITHVDVVGLATDYCVRATVLDALGLGFQARVLLSMCAGVRADTSAKAITDMLMAGAVVVASDGQLV